MLSLASGIVFAMFPQRIDTVLADIMDVEDALHCPL